MHIAVTLFAVASVLLHVADAFQFVSQSNELQMVDGVLQNFNDLTINCLPTDASNPTTIQVLNTEGGLKNVTITCSKHSYIYSTSVIGHTLADTTVYQTAACRTTASYKDSINSFNNRTVNATRQTRTLLHMDTDQWIETGLIGGGALMMSLPLPGVGAVGAFAMAAGAIMSIVLGGSGGIDPAIINHINAEIGQLRTDQQNQLNVQARYNAAVQKNENLVAGAIGSIKAFDVQQSAFDAQTDLAINLLNKQVGALEDAQKQLTLQTQRNFDEVYKQQDLLFQENAQLAQGLNSTVEDVVQLATFVDNLKDNVANITNTISNTVQDNHLTSLRKLRALSALVLRVTNLLDQVASGSDIFYEINREVQRHLADIRDKGYTPFLPDAGYSGGDLFEDTIELDNIKIIGVKDSIGNGEGVELSLKFVCNATGLIDLNTPFRSLDQFFPYMNPTGCSITAEKRTCDLRSVGEVEAITDLPPSDRDPGFDSMCADTPVVATPEVFVNVSMFADYLQTFACENDLKTGEQWLVMSFITQFAMNVDASLPELVSPCESTFYGQMSGDGGLTLIYVIAQTAASAFMFVAPNLESFRDEINGYMPNGLYWDHVPYYRDEATGSKYSCDKAMMVAVDESSIVPVKEYTFTGVAMTVTVEIEGEDEPRIYTNPVGTSEFESLLPPKMIIAGEPTTDNFVFDIPFTGTETSLNVDDRGVYYLMSNETSRLNYNAWINDNLSKFNPWFAGNSPGNYRRPVDELLRKCTDPPQARHGTLCQILNEFEIASEDASTVRFTSEGLTNAYQFTIRIPEGQVLVVETSNCPFVQSTVTSTGVLAHLTNNLNGALTCQVAITGPCPVSYSAVTIPARGSVQLWIPSCAVGNRQQILNVTTASGGPCIALNVTTVITPTGTVTGLASSGSVVISQAEITSEFHTNLLEIGRELATLNLQLLHLQLDTLSKQFVLGGIDLEPFRRLSNKSSDLIAKLEGNAQDALARNAANMASINHTDDEINANLTAAIAENNEVNQAANNLSNLVTSIENTNNNTNTLLNQLVASNTVLDGLRALALNLQNITDQDLDSTLSLISYALSQVGGRHANSMCVTILGGFGGVLSTSNFVGNIMCTVLKLVLAFLLIVVLWKFAEYLWNRRKKPKSDEPPQRTQEIEMQQRSQSKYQRVGETY